jgi:hypothetical protein
MARLARAAVSAVERWVGDVEDERDAFPAAPVGAGGDDACSSCSALAMWTSQPRCGADETPRGTRLSGNRGDADLEVRPGIVRSGNALGGRSATVRRE